MRWICLALITACSHETTPAKTPTATGQPVDPAKHTVQHVDIGGGVSLEVLDFGGSGEPIVLLAGLGNTAHTFDDFAPALTAKHHVLAVTRRGFPGSSAPATGYDPVTRTADDIAVLDAMKIPHAIFAGHSIAGDELTELGISHPGRVTGLIYLDASHDHSMIRELFATMPIGEPEPPKEVNASWTKLVDWQAKTMGVTLPIGEFVASVDISPDGSVKGMKGDGKAAGLIIGAATAPDFSKVHKPVLVFFAGRPSPETFPGFDQLPADKKKAFVDWFPAFLRIRDKAVVDAKTFPDARVVELPHTEHYVFISDRTQVLQEIEAFVGTLK